MYYKLALVQITGGPLHDDLVEDTCDRMADMRATQPIDLKVAGVEKELLIRAETIYPLKLPRESPQFIAKLVRSASSLPDSQEEPPEATWWKVIGRTGLLPRGDYEDHEVFFGYYDARKMQGYALIACEALYAGRLKRALPEAKFKCKKITEEQFDLLCRKW